MRILVKVGMDVVFDFKTLLLPTNGYILNIKINMKKKISCLDEFCYKHIQNIFTIL